MRGKEAGLVRQAGELSPQGPTAGDRGDQGEVKTDKQRGCTHILCLVHPEVAFEFFICFSFLTLGKSPLPLSVSQLRMKLGWLIGLVGALKSPWDSPEFAEIWTLLSSERPSLLGACGLSALHCSEF